MKTKQSEAGDASVADARRLHLQEWLHEWAIDRALRETAPTDPVPGRTRPIGRTVMRPRDIVLLHPADTPSAERPVYVALLDGPESEAWLAAPFGRFASPAGDGEWRTGRAAAPLRVLCLWNVRHMPPAAIARGWRAGRLTVREHAAALRVLRAWRGGEELDARTRACTGAPIIHPRDPRRDYEDEEAQWMDEAAADPEDRRGPVPGYEVPDSEWAQAAEPPRTSAPPPPRRPGSNEAPGAAPRRKSRTRPKG